MLNRLLTQSERPADDDTAPTGRTDRGSALVMAIVFVTVIGLVVTMALGYSAVSLRASSQHYVPARDRMYKTDAAMKAAVQNVIANPAAGRSQAGGKCLGSSTYGKAGADSVTVQVCPQGANSLTAKAGASAWGLITLATTTEKGLLVAGKKGLQVYGSVAANSAIDVNTSSLLAVSGGTVKALGGCSGPITVDGVTLPSCTVATAPGVMPPHTTGVTARPANTTAVCNTTTKVATVPPGTWTAATRTEIAKCTSVVLQSGVHYLEDLSWSIKNKVVGGELAVAASALGTTAIGSACTKGTKGVTVILGGTTQIDLNGGSLELCGASVLQADSTSVKLPIYGLTADVTSGSGSSVTMTPNSTDTGSDWSNEINAYTSDGLYAKYDLKQGAKSEDLVLGGFGGSTTIPSSVTKLTADVKGYASGTTTYTLTVANGTSKTNICSSSSATTFASTNTVQSVTLNCTAALTPPLTLRLVATASNSGTDRSAFVDSVALKYGTTPTVVMKAQSGCVSAANGCNVINMQGNGDAMWMDGEIFLPLAKIKAQVPNTALNLSTLGIVVRVLDVLVPASATSQPTVAQDNAALNDGDTTVVVSVAGTVWMTCRVGFTASGSTVSKATVSGCTIPR